MMTWCENCPECQSEDYEVNDYQDDFDYSGGSRWWTCTCSKCGCKFTITQEYKLIDVTIEKESE